MHRRASLAVVGLLGLTLFVSGCYVRKSTKGSNTRRKATAAKKVSKAQAKPPVQIPTAASEPEVTFESEGAGEGFTLHMADNISMEFIRLGRGWFIMGGGSTGIERHKARIDRPFFLGKYEVTQEQWELVMGTNPSLSKQPKNPLNRVSWTDCLEFADRMNKRYPRPGHRYGLPTETQWEYACRAGGNLSGYTAIFGGFVLDNFAWHAGNSGNDLHPVGQKRANAWGFYDILGNVAEWCDDDDRLPLTDPYPPGQHVVRGGGYHDGDTLCNIEGRYVRRNNIPFRFDGLRLACVEDP